MDFKSLTLAGLRATLNPTENPDIDARELRASSATSAMRVKTRPGMFTSTSARQAHVRYAVAQVMMCAGNSIREKLQVGATHDICKELETVKAVAGDISKSITLRVVKNMDEAVQGLDRKSASPAASPDLLQSLPSQELFNTPADRQRKEGPVHLHQAPSGASSSPSAASSVQVDSCLEKLKTEHYSKKQLSSLTDHEVAHFHERLKELVEFAGRVRPRLVTSEKGYASLLLAAGYLRQDKNLPFDAALYRAAGGDDIYRALSPAGKESISGGS